MMFKEPEDVTRARQLDRAGREIEFITFVKTAPTPSTQYEETVCVAGVALDPLRLVRLYPIGFRRLKEESQFEKYSKIRISVRQPSNDFRVESLRVESEPEILRPAKPGWDTRSGWLPNFVNDTLCALRENIKADPNGRSLSVIEPRTTPRIEVRKSAGFTKAQRERIDLWAKMDLFGNEPLRHEAANFEAWLSFECRESACNGHRLSLIDWEAYALQRRVGNPDDLALAQHYFQEQFIDKKFKPGKTTLLLVGNQAKATNRASFVALGIFGPFSAQMERLF